jgi:translocation and assembly module TamB
MRTRMTIWSLRIALALTCFVALLLAGLLTTVGQRAALSLAGYIASSKDTVLTIGRLDGSLFDEGQIDHIAIGDNEGTWLDIRNIRFSWSVLSLLSGRLIVKDLHVASVHVARKPAPSDQPSTKPSSSTQSLIPISLKKVQVDELVLGEEFTGTTTRFQIEASAHLIDHRQGLSAQLSVTRLDRPGAKVAAQFGFDAAQRNLKIQLSASESADGIVATLLGLPDAPALSLKFSGKGPLDAWQAEWSMSASDQPFVAGRVRLDRNAERHRLATDFSGYVESIVPTAISGLLPGKTTGSLIGFFTGFDRFDAKHILLQSDALRLQGAGGIVPASSYVYGSISAKISRDDGNPVRFTTSTGDPVSLTKLDLRLAVPNTETSRDLKLDVDAEGLAHPKGTLSKVNLSASLTQPNPVGSTALDADGIAVQLRLNGLSSPLIGLAEAVGPVAKLDLSGSFKAGILAVEKLRIGNASTYLTGQGQLSQDEHAGTAKLVINDLSPFSTLYGKPIAGRANITAKTSADFSGGAFGVSFDGASSDLKLGQDIVAGLIGPKVKFSGELARDTSGGIKLKKFDVAGANMIVTASGTYSNDAIELDHTFKVPNLSALQPELTGAVMLAGQLHGTQRNLTSKFRVTSKDATWRGHAVKQFQLGFNGKGPLTAHAGYLKLDGRVGPRTISSNAKLTFGSTGTFVAKEFELALGRIKVAGDVSLAPGAVPVGKFKLDASKLSDLEILLGQSISGGLTGAIELSELNKEPLVKLAVDAPNLRIGGNTIKGLKASADLKNYLAGINGTASLKLARVSGDGMKANNITLDLRDASGRVAFSGAGIINEANVNLNGSFAQQGKAYDIAIDRATLRQGALKVRLQESARLTVVDAGVRIDQFRLITDRGRIEIKGSANATVLNLDAVVSQLPAKLANIFVPSLGLAGLINARATVRGKPANPIATIESKWTGATARTLRESFLPPATILLDGRFSDGIARAKLNVQGPQALSLAVDGEAMIKSGKKLNFRLKGDIPLALANATLAARATQLSGRATISGAITGTISTPKIAARISIPNATVYDPSSGLKLKQLVGLFHVTERGVEIRSLRGQSDLGGTVSLGGKIAIDGNAPVQLQLKLAQLKFNERKLIAGEVDGTINVAGPMDALSAKGSVYIHRMDVTVPAAAPGSVATLNIRHVNAPGAGPASGKRTKRPAKSTTSTNVQLDLRIDAANRIFVKGRGLDAQLGGGLKVLGSSNSPTADGAFQMERGRLDILGRRLSFRHGRILFDGTLEPRLDMEAVTTADDVTIIVTITGAASKPVFKFSSSPELPEDEVIARLLFNKALVGLSPLQLVQLASEVDKIGGLSSGPGILDKLKSSVGIDVLDVSTDKSGAATVSAGRYVDDKIFVGVRQGTNTKTSRVIIEHDLTKSLKARGEVGADGNSKLGVGFEWNY